MTFQNVQQAYTNNTGTTPTNWPVFYARDPVPNDIAYSLGKFWINNGPVKKLWYLASQSNVITAANPTGALQSDWELISVNPSLLTLSDTANTTVSPSGSGDSPPNNIQLIGAGGVTVTSNPLTHSITISTAAIAATTFQEDTGTATPAGNILNIFGNDTTANDNDGITTTGAGNTVTVLLTNRLQGATTTVGAASSNIISFTPTIIGTYTIECRVAAYNTTSSLGAGYSLFGAVRFDGVNSNLTGTVDKVVNEEGAMSAANVNMTVSAGAINIVGTGYLGQTINWSAVALYTFVGV